MKHACRIKNLPWTATRNTFPILHSGYSMIRSIQVSRCVSHFAKYCDGSALKLEIRGTNIDQCSLVYSSCFRCLQQFSHASRTTKSSCLAFLYSVCSSRPIQWVHIVSIRAIGSQEYNELRYIVLAREYQTSGCSSFPEELYLSSLPQCHGFWRQRHKSLFAAAVLFTKPF